VERIDRFHVQGELARGGMGVVYRGVDPVDRSPVAIKLIQGDKETPSRLARFQREADALIKLDHPNVVSVRAVGLHGVHPYLVMDLVAGDSLQDKLIREGPLSNDQSANLVRDIAAAVAHMHGHGVIHRDLKPENVLLAGERPLLTDFGLALDLSDTRSRLTQTGALMGTPGYWPPELALGQKDRVGPASDIYGLGAVLYACLTGRPPVQGASLQQLVDATLKGDVTPPRRLRAEVAPALSDVCMRALAVDPEDRFPSTSELIAALEGWTRGSGSRASSIAERLLPRHATKRLGALAFVGALGIGIAASLIGPSNAPTPPQPVKETPAAAVSSSTATPPPVVPEQVQAVERGFPGWCRGLRDGIRLRLLEIWSDGPGYLTHNGKSLVVAGGMLVSASEPGMRPPPMGFLAKLQVTGPVRVWDPETGREQMRLATGDEYVRALAASADGNWLAAGIERGVQVWDARSWTLVQTLPPPGGGSRTITSLAFSPDASRLAVAGWSREREEEPPPIHVWDVRRGELLVTVPGPASYVAFRGDDQLVTVGRWNSRVALWDLTGPERRFEAKTGSSLCVRVTDDGRWALTTHWKNESIVVWDLEAGEVAREVVCPTSPVQILLLDGGLDVIAVGQDGVVMRVDAAEGELLDAGPRPPGWMFAAALLPDGHVVTAGTTQRLSRVGVDLKPANWPDDLLHEGAVLAAVYVEDARVAVTPLGVWEWYRDGKGLRQTVVRNLADAAGAPDGRSVLIAQAKAAAAIDLEQKTVISRTGVHDKDELVAIGPAPAGNHSLISLGTGRSKVPDKLFHVWHQVVGEATEARWIPLTDGDAALDARCLVVTPDGARGFSGHDDGTVRSWDLLDDSLLRRYRPGLDVAPRRPARGEEDWEDEEEEPEVPPVVPEAEVVMVVTATSRAVFAGDRAGVVRGWALADGTELPTLRAAAAGDAVVALAAADADLGLLLAGYASGALRLWDTGAAKVLDVVHLDGDFARCMTLSPDGDRVLVGTQRGHLIELVFE
jgi:WD40 repeat protein